MFQNLCQQWLKTLPEQDPEVWKFCYPRAYKVSDKFGSPKVAAAVLATAIGWVQISGVSDVPNAALNIFISAAKLAKYHIPALFIAPEFLTAATQTTPPPDLTWDDIHLPFDAALLMLPKQWLKHPDSGYCDFIGYAKVREGEQLSLPISRCPRFTLKETSFIVFTGCHEDPNMPLFYKLLSLSKMPHVGTENIDLKSEYTNKKYYNLPLSQSEEQFLQHILNSVFRVLLALEAMPEMLEHGKRDGKQKKGATELWTPNIIGRNYSFKSEPTNNVGNGNAHISKSIFWRRGHFRSQAYGTAHSLRKRIWIEPVLVQTH